MNVYERIFVYICGYTGIALATIAIVYISFNIFKLMRF